MSQTLLEKLSPQGNPRLLSKIIIFMVLLGICLVPTVKAIGLGPTQLGVTVEKGAETSFTRNILVWNSLETPLHVKATVSGSIAPFIKLEPEEFDLAAGPGMSSEKPSPSQYVVVTFSIPREVAESKYTGTITFSEAPTQGGTLATAIALDVGVKLNIGTMAKAKFPVYVTALIVILTIMLISSVVVVIMRRYYE